MYNRTNIWMSRWAENGVFVVFRKAWWSREGGWVHRKLPALIMEKNINSSNTMVVVKIISGFIGGGGGRMGGRGMGEQQNADKTDFSMLGIDFRRVLVFCISSTIYSEECV